jgi:N-acetyl-anhydromuramyl-L-alanine amidase AmpD
MRQIDLIVIHCSATHAGKDFRAADIDKWHRAKGWNGIGYHFVIDLDGTIETGRPLEVVGSHVQGHNSRSIGIVYIGGLGVLGSPMDTRTPMQQASMLNLVTQLHRQFPNARIVGHRDLSPDKDGDGMVERWEWMKECPSFDVGQWVEETGILRAM